MNQLFIDLKGNILTGCSVSCVSNADEQLKNRITAIRRCERPNADYLMIRNASVMTNRFLSGTEDRNAECNPDCTVDDLNK